MNIKSLPITRFVAALLVPVFVAIYVPFWAFAVSPSYSISVNSQVLAPFAITLQGVASGNPYVGQLDSHRVRVVDWGDNSGETEASFTVTSFTDNPKTFQATWSASHTYAAVGPYTITIAVCHSQCSGAEGADNTVTVNVIIPPATITVIKHVVNTGGGTASASDFTMYVSGTNPSPATFAGAESPGTTVSVDPGFYSVTEDSVAGYTGSFSAQCSGTIASGETKTCTVTNTFGPNNHPVLAPIGDKAVDELDQLTFTASASDEDDDPLTYSLSGAPAGASIGSLTGEFSWTPTEAQGPGDYAFDVVVSDGNGGSDSETITVQVAEVNVAPVAEDTSHATHVNVPALITLSASDSDIPIEILSLSLVSGPSHGSLSAISGNEVTYTPELDFVGLDSFTFKANDGTADSNVATVDISVSNEAPILDEIGDQTVDELDVLAFFASAADPDGDALSYSLSGLNVPAGASIGSLTGEFSWTPTEAQGPGEYTFTIEVTDGVTVDSETITVTVNEVNVAPTTEGASVVTDEDTSLNVDLPASDVDIPIEIISLSLVSGPSSGSLGPIVGSTVLYTPNSNFNGADSFTFQATDSHGAQSNVSTIDITVNPTDDPQCSDGTDNDDDGLVDLQDPGCSDASDNDETDPVVPPPSACSDGLDNDQDGLVDLQDPGCSDASDNDEADPVVPPPSGGGGGGGSSDGGGLSTASTGPGVPAPTVQPQGEVLGEAVCSVEYLKEYIKLGRKNNPGEVKKLQEFLNSHLGLNMPVTGFYGPVTFAAVNQFQVKYGEQVLRPWMPYGHPNVYTPTGYVYKTTKRWINMLNCPDLNLPIPPLP